MTLQTRNALDQLRDTYLEAQMELARFASPEVSLEDAIVDRLVKNEAELWEALIEARKVFKDA